MVLKLLLMAMLKNPLQQPPRRTIGSSQFSLSRRLHFLPAQLPAAATPANNSAFRNFYNCIYTSVAVSLANFYLGARQTKKSLKNLTGSAPICCCMQCSSEKLMESRLTMRDLRDVTRSYLHTMLTRLPHNLTWSWDPKKREQSSAAADNFNI